MPLLPVRIMGRLRLLLSTRAFSASQRSSLIPETLEEMQEDASIAPSVTAQGLREAGAKRLSLEERKRRRRALEHLNIASFRSFLQEKGLALTRTPMTTLQLNVGLYCNQACNHCHVESSPKRKEMMDRTVADKCLEFLRNSPTIKTLDLTGGAPELNSQFRYLVEQASPLGVEIIDRCNLTVLEEPGQEDLGHFLADHKVKVVASLPCYEEKNVRIQRGSSVFKRSIAGLRKLNDNGYGIPGTGLELTLVYNPVGAFLPPPQPALEAKYKEELLSRYGIHFNSLYCITNMPIKRFADALYKAGKLREYMDLLVKHFNKDAVEGLMCRNHLSVGWEGRIYDCDFNQQLGLTLNATRGELTERQEGEERAALTIFDVQHANDLLQKAIRVDAHCFGCTAGEGSSCGGTTTIATK